MSCISRNYQPGVLRTGFTLVPLLWVLALPAHAAEQPQIPRVEQAVPAAPEMAAPETGRAQTPGYKELNEQMQPDRDVNGISPGCPYNHQELNAPLLG